MEGNEKGDGNFRFKGTPRERERYVHLSFSSQCLSWSHIHIYSNREKIHLKGNQIGQKTKCCFLCPTILCLMPVFEWCKRKYKICWKTCNKVYAIQYNI